MTYSLLYEMEIERNKLYDP